MEEKKIIGTIYETLTDVNGNETETAEEITADFFVEMLKKGRAKTATAEEKTRLLLLLNTILKEFEHTKDTEEIKTLNALKSIKAEIEAEETEDFKQLELFPEKTPAPKISELSKEQLIYIDHIIEEKALVQFYNGFDTVYNSLAQREMQLLEIYLSCIDSHNPQRRTLVITKKELSRVLGVERLRTSQLDTYTSNLQKPVYLRDRDEKTGFKKIVLFDEAEAIADDRGEIVLRLTCSTAAIKYIFNAENIGYLKYYLKKILQYKTMPGTRLYKYIGNNIFRAAKNGGSWEDTSEKIIEVLTGETYKNAEFKYFNIKILKPAIEEYNRNEDVKITYSLIKKNRKVEKIKFSILDKVIDSADFNKIEDGATGPLWAEAADYLKLTAEQQNEIAQLLPLVPESALPILENVPNDRDIYLYHYIALKIAALKRAEEENQSKGTPIRNKYKYFLLMIKNDLKT